MGWASAGEIFDPVCSLIVKGVEGKAIAEDEATKVLKTLIAKLQDGDWDTEEESLAAFVDHSCVVAAFVAQGVEVQSWMDVEHVGDEDEEEDE